MNAPLRSNVALASFAALASTGTLVCCVLPAVMVTLGAGAALAGLVGAVPQLVWLSAHKGLVFGIAALALMVAGFALLGARRLPCPIEPGAARACLRLRRLSSGLYLFALLAFAAGTTFAFLLPVLAG